VRPKRSGTTRIDHPQLGKLELSFEKLPLPETDGQILVVYHAAPGSRTAQALALLATQTAAAAAAEPRRPAPRGA
jgi:hypothetical protein